MAEIFRFHCEAENEMHGITFRFDFWSILAKIVDFGRNWPKTSEMAEMFWEMFPSSILKVVNFMVMKIVLKLNYCKKCA